MTSPIRSGDSGVNRSVAASLPTIASVAKDSLETIRQSLSCIRGAERAKWANSKNERGMTPLAVAIEAHSEASNKMDIITFLVCECSADPNSGDNDNWTPLYRAATGTRGDALLFLLDHNADPNVCNKDGSTPLHRLVDRGNEADARTLILKGADVNAINCVGTSLGYAAKNGNISIATILLDAGADPNLINDPLGATPATLAANNGKEEMAALLLARKGQLMLPIDSKVHTSLSRLVHEGDEGAILGGFIDGATDEYGRTAAHYCAHLGKRDILEKMYSLGNIDTTDSKGRTPLHYAVMKGHEELVGSLVGSEGGSSLESRDLQGYAPLMWACQFNQVAIAKLLLNRAAEKNILNSVLDISDNFGWKAIHKAAQVGNVDLVRMFVEEYKVDHTQLTSNGRTPLDLAKVTNASACIDYLNSLTVPLPEGISKV